MKFKKFYTSNLAEDNRRIKQKDKTLILSHVNLLVESPIPKVETKGERQYLAYTSSLLKTNHASGDISLILGDYCNAEISLYCRLINQ